MINSSIIQRINEARSRTSRWQELKVEEISAYQDAHKSLVAMGRAALDKANTYGEFELNFTSGFNPNSGIRGSLPKDLWFSLSPKGSVLGMPQIYLIVSQKGMEYGFAPVIHPSDFSDSNYKKKLGNRYRL